MYCSMFRSRIQGRGEYVLVQSNLLRQWILKYFAPIKSIVPNKHCTVLFRRRREFLFHQILKTAGFEMF